MGSYWQLSFNLDGTDPSRAEESCFACGASSVTFVDARDDPVLEPLPGEFRLWPSTRVRALFEDAREPGLIVRALCDALNIPAAGVQVERIEDRAWEREWLRDFHAMSFGRRLWICPQHEIVTAPGAAVVRMDPGLAFGTGTHPSTALCLEWLDSRVQPNWRIIDFGCGSGILAIAALKLGASHAYCFDIDPQALIAAADNARTNEVESRISIVADAALLPRDADLLVANILSGPLCELAPSLQAMVRPGGWIVLAGLLQVEIPDVTRAYAAWFDIRPFGSRGDWVGLSGTRRVQDPHTRGSVDANRIQDSAERGGQ